jgi:hypothetical protein
VGVKGGSNAVRVLLEEGDHLGLGGDEGLFEVLVEEFGLIVDEDWNAVVEPLDC